jgi:hypothetical protein
VTDRTNPENAQYAGRGIYFVQIPTYLIDLALSPDSPVNAGAVLLYAHIVKTYAWRNAIFPSYARLAGEVGMSESTIRRFMTNLKLAGAITWGHRTSSQGRSTNEYAIAPWRPNVFDREVPLTSEHHHPLTSEHHHPLTSEQGSKREVEVREKTKKTPVVDAEVLFDSDEASPPEPAGAVAPGPLARGEKSVTDQLAARWYDAKDGMANYQAVRQIVASAGRKGFTADQVAFGLDRLLETGKPLTLTTLRDAIVGMPTSAAGQLGTTGRKVAAAMDLAARLRAEGR